MSRGDRREEIFRDDSDRKRFLEVLGKACVKDGWRVHADQVLAERLTQCCLREVGWDWAI